MASKYDKAPDNVPGPYYNDNTCIDCDQCREVAPQFFKRQDDGGYTYVYRQPVTPEEIAVAEEALSICPTDTIGNDGEEVEASSPLPPTPNLQPADSSHIPDESHDGALEQTLAKKHEAGADA